MERVFFIDRKLRTMGAITLEQVTSNFEVSSRQIKRDIEYMRDRLNAPIIWLPSERHYIYSKPFKELQFADQKLILFYVLMKSILGNEQYIPVYSEEMIASVEKDVPADYREVCSHIIYQLPQSEHIDPDFFMTVCSAIRDKTILMLEYSNLQNKTSKRKVEAERLLNYDGSWYIVAYDHLRQGLRNFNFARIKSLTASKEPFSDHGPEYQQEVSNYMSNAFGVFKGEQTELVKIRFYNQGAKIAESQSWHPDQKARRGEETDSRSTKEQPYLELEFPVADYTEVLARILTFGANARPISPPDLCLRWQQECIKMAAMAEHIDYDH